MQYCDESFVKLACKKKSFYIIQKPLDILNRMYMSPAESFPHCPHSYPLFQCLLTFYLCICVWILSLKNTYEALFVLFFRFKINT